MKPPNIETEFPETKVKDGLFGIMPLGSNCGRLSNISAFVKEKNKSKQNIEYVRDKKVSYINFEEIYNYEESRHPTSLKTSKVEHKKSEIVFSSARAVKQIDNFFPLIKKNVVSDRRPVIKNHIVNLPQI